MDKREHYAKAKKPDTESHILWNIQDMQTHRDRKEVGENGEWGVPANGQFSFRGDRNVLELDNVMVAKLCEYTKTYTYLKTEFYSIWIISQYKNLIEKKWQAVKDYLIYDALCTESLG